MGSPSPSPTSSGGWRISKPSPSIMAGARFFASPRVRAALVWLMASVVLPAAGWVATKLDDTKRELISLRLEFGTLAGQQRELAKSITDLVDTLSGERKQLIAIRRDLVMATAAAAALESEKRRTEKLRAAKLLAEAYDRLIDQGVHPAAAAETVLAKIAVP